MHNRRDFLRILGTAAAAGAGAQLGCQLNTLGARLSGRRPNVVIVMTDDQGYGELGCLGNPIIRTPNLDRLHGQSVRLNDFHVDPTCAPTRAALMTGRYSIRTGIWHTIMGRSMMRRDEITLADRFSDADYTTGIFGKWHLGDNYPYRPQDRGFQERVVHGGGGVNQTPDYWGNDYFDDTYDCNEGHKKFEGYCTDVFFDQAISFIERHKDEPFFCYLPTNAPHSPYWVADKYSRPYLEQGLPETRANFYGMIENFDNNMGRLLAHLEKLGLDDNTIFIFMTDNGTAQGVDMDEQGHVTAGYNNDMRGKKGMLFDGGHRVPCFIRWPKGDLVNRDVDALTAHVDITPTLIELCGLPWDATAFDGRSLAADWAGQKYPFDRTLVLDQQRIDRPEKWRNYAVLTTQWRLVNDELFDIKRDPGQQHDVAAEHPDVYARLREEYRQWWASVSTKFDTYCEIVLGSEHENPSRLTCHDWHTSSDGQVPWNQRLIREGLWGNGYWAVEFAQPGMYEFTLRRWPREASETGMDADRARLGIGTQELEQPIPAGAGEVIFRTHVLAGSTTIQTWLSGAQLEKPRGAYYVYVKRL